ncbi:hypothetical protein H1V43_17185 [Streptomyces sp. PSKA54]|uniref:Uncharacterized protein n=1 Tax=Streptomyces himalayensis subsp. aureolus TaxID=2758039 RepID=A0A7W2HGK9_9ACTN|nr:hypothetical protein [Streptomyces himalayensis]MBA4863083.1 hypothetical protein [Streptomyces himalayensis subsp. aureolus]
MNLTDPTDREPEARVDALFAAQCARGLIRYGRQPPQPGVAMAAAVKGSPGGITTPAPRSSSEQCPQGAGGRFRCVALTAEFMLFDDFADDFAASLADWAFAPSA